LSTLHSVNMRPRQNVIKIVCVTTLHYLFPSCY